MEESGTSQYPLVNLLVNKLENNGDKGASAVLHAALQSGRVDIVEIFFENPTFDWSNHEGIYKLLEASENEYIVEMLEDYRELGSDITESDSGSSRGSLLNYYA